MARLQYDSSRTCPECGHDDVTTRYCQGGTSCNRFPFEDGAHLDRQCRRCGYAWAEDRLPEQMIRVPTPDQIGRKNRDRIKLLEAMTAALKAENERLRAEPERSLGYVYESLTHQPWDASRGPLTANCLWIEIGKWIDQARADEREKCAAQCRSVAEQYRDLYACHLNQERQYIARKCADAILSTTRPYSEFRAELVAEDKLLLLKEELLRAKNAETPRLYGALRSIIRAASVPLSEINYAALHEQLHRCRDLAMDAHGDGWDIDDGDCGNGA